MSDAKAFDPDTLKRPPYNYNHEPKFVVSIDKATITVDPVAFTAVLDFSVNSMGAEELFSFLRAKMDANPNIDPAVNQSGYVMLFDFTTMDWVYPNEQVRASFESTKSLCDLINNAWERVSNKDYLGGDYVSKSGNIIEPNYERMKGSIQFSPKRGTTGSMENLIKGVRSLRFLLLDIFVGLAVGTPHDERMSGAKGGHVSSMELGEVRSELEFIWLNEWDGTNTELTLNNGGVRRTPWDEGKR